MIPLKTRKIAHNLLEYIFAWFRMKHIYKNIPQKNIMFKTYFMV